jgi:hypothetical protein
MSAREIHRPASTFVERAARMHDRARQMMVRAGAVPWRTAVISWAWTGGGEGRGTPKVTGMLELTPPPDVTGEGSLKGTPSGAGFVRNGVVRLVGISSTYTEGDLDILFRVLAPGELVLIEVVHDTRDGSITPPRRLYKPVGTPERDVTSAQWSLTISSVQNQTTRYDSGAWWRAA